MRKMYAIILFEMIKPRLKRFIEELPLNRNQILPSAVKAGYSPKYAKANGRRLVKTAQKAQIKEMIEIISKDDTTLGQVKRKMYEIVGMTRQELFENIAWLARQEKDLGVRLKVLTPFLKEEGINMATDDDKEKVIPFLNISVRENKKEIEEEDISKDNNIIDANISSDVATQDVGVPNLEA